MRGGAGAGAGRRRTPAARPTSILPDLGHGHVPRASTATRCCSSASSSAALGLLFGLVIYQQLKNLPVHQSMREISELIYETCKTYLIQQGKFLLILELFIGVDHRVLLRRAAALRGR